MCENMAVLLITLLPLDLMYYTPSASFYINEKAKYGQAKVLTHFSHIFTI